jgi:hypothetical protein
LRAYIDSQGWKTYAAVLPGIVCGILAAANVITLEVYQLLVAAFAPITAATLQQAETKAKNGK